MRTRRILGIGSLGILLGFASALLGQAAPGGGSAEWNGEWELTTLYFGVPLAERLRLEVDRGRVTGSVRHQGKDVPITGTTGAAADGSIRFEYQGADGSRNVYEGKRGADGTLSGRATSRCIGVALVILLRAFDASAFAAARLPRIHERSFNYLPERILS